MWDERYNSDDYVYGTEPNDFLARNYQRIPPGRVLCLAEGEGRNAVFLAVHGYQVTAVDASRVGLEKAERLAQREGVSIELIHADLNDFDLGHKLWNGIVSIFCHLPSALRRRVYSQLSEALLPRGVFLLEAYTPRQLAFGTGGPGDVDLLVEPADLRRELAGLDVAQLAEVDREVIEGRFHTGRAAVVQVIGEKPDDRRFMVSSNRGAATHKLRYVESGGGENAGDCRLCSPTIKPRDG